jgi:DNA-binding MarR family transcriptional regulator
MLVKHLLIILQELQEEKGQKTQITDDYYNYLLSSLAKEPQELTKSLIHYLTLLNKSFREKENQVYQSTHEDVHLALELVQDVIKPQSILTQKEQSQLEELEQKYLTGNFTRKEVQGLLNLSKSQTHRLLTKLENLNLLQKQSSYKNQGYVYNLGSQTIDIQDLFSDNENIEFSDIR